MSTEQQPASDSLPTYAAYAVREWKAALVSMQNTGEWADQPVLINGIFQRLCAESILGELREVPFLRRFGGKTLQVIMIPTDTPFMYNLGLVIEDNPPLHSI